MTNRFPRHIIVDRLKNLNHLIKINQKYLDSNFDKLEYWMNGRFNNTVFE